MNKTIIINISGAIFHIEEDAYEILRNYMTDVKKHFGLSPDSFEIVTDIENRIAELFTELLKRDLKQVIVIENVQEIINQMGLPSDFGNETGIPQAAGNDTGAINEAPIIRKLYRDVDDKVIGGVCSGLGHYFDIEPVWIRLIWAILFFAGGIGFIAYIILWISMPPARSRAERLSMKGQRVNLETIKNSVTEELKDVKQNLISYKNQLEQSGIGERIELFFKEVFTIIGKFFRIAFSLVSGFIGAVLILTGSLVLIVLLVVAMTLLLSPTNATWTKFPFIILQSNLHIWAVISVVIAVFIPFLFLVLLGIHILFKKFYLNTSISVSLLIVWLIMFSFAGYIALSTVYQNNEQASIDHEVEIKTPLTKSLFIKADNSSDYLNSINENELSKKDGKWNIELNDDYDSRRFLNLQIDKSDSTAPILLEQFHAKGINKHEALKHADQISYSFSQQDSILKFPQNIHYNTANGFHLEFLEMTLKLPIGFTIRVDPALHIINLPDAEDYSFNGPNNIWIMTSEGLKPKFGLHKKEEN